MPYEAFATLGRRRLVQQLSSLTELTPEDEAQLAALPMRVVTVLQQHDITRQGEKPSDCSLVISGLACRYRMVAGGRRQILSLHHPGDLPDLQCLELDRMDYGLAALTRTDVALIPHSALLEMLGNSPTLSRVFKRHELADASIHREWIANIGQRDASMRVGHLFCEVYTRLRAAGVEDGEAVTLCMTQAEIGEAMGLSPVHVNRVMQKLRTLGLIRSAGQTHTILDWDALQRASDFDPAYLHLRAPSAVPA